MGDKGAARMARDYISLREGLHEIDAGMSIYDADFRLVACNRVFREIFALPEEMTLPGTPFDPVLRLLVSRGLYGEVDVESFVSEALRQLARMQGSFVYERQVPDGRIFESRTTRLSSGGFITVHTDITRHKEIEASLRESREQLLETSGELSLILENASLGILTVVPAANGRRVLRRVNRALERLLGYEHGEMAGLDTRSLYPDEREYQQVTRAYQDIVCAGQMHHAEYLFRRKDGSTLIGDLRGSAVDPADPARGAVWLVEDVTTQRAMAAELGRKTALLQAGTDHMPGAMVVWDSALNYVYWTPRAESYFRLPPGTLRVGMPFRQMARYFAERGDFGAGEIEELVEMQMRPFLQRESMLVERLMPDGGVLEVRREPLPDGGYVSVFQDITPRKRMEEDLRQAKEAAEMALAALRQKSEQIAALLDNSGQGFLSFGADLCVTGEYSRACVALLGRMPDGAYLPDLLFPEQPASAALLCDVVAQTLACGDREQRNLLLHQLPGELHLGDKFLRTEFRSLDNGLLMLVLTDVSDEKRLRALSMTDRLTGLSNRHHLDEWLDEGLEHVRRTGLPLALLLIDLDHFKVVNDDFGHLVGDQVLIELAGILRQQMRRIDRIGRWGGEEFVVLCFDTPQEGALTLAEKLRAAVAAHPFLLVGACSCSIGVACAHTGDTPESLIARADQALYRAKNSGRNRVVAGD